jgi:hypothetical protein
LAGRFVHPGGVELVVVAAGILGVIHRRVGVAQQGVGILAVAREQADADARRGVQHMIGHLVILGQTALDLAGNAGGGQRTVDFRQDHDEFIAAQPGYQVAGPDAAAQALRHFLQQFVADVMAQRVVDVLEIVEIDQHQGQLPGLPLADAQGVGELGIERQTVGQVGQRVVIGQLGQTVGRFLVGADVGEVGDMVLDVAGAVADQRNGQPFRVGRAVLALVPDFTFPVVMLVQGVPHPGVKIGADIPGGEKPRVFADHVVARVAGQLGEGGIDRDNPVVAVGNQHGLAVLLEGAQQYRPGQPVVAGRRIHRNLGVHLGVAHSDWLFRHGYLPVRALRR